MRRAYMYGGYPLGKNMHDTFCSGDLHVIHYESGIDYAVDPLPTYKSSGNGGG